MHFDYTRPGGVWSGSDVLATAEIADLDSKTERAVNGDEGGTWAPTTKIVFGGQGIEVTGAFISTECQGIDLTLGEINVFSGARVRLLSGGILDLDSGADVDIECNVEVKSGGALLYRSGSQHIANSGSSTTFQTGATLTVQAGVTTTIAADVTQTGKITHSGAGGRVAKRVMTVTNAPAFVNVGDCDILFWETTDGNAYDVTLETAPLPSDGEQITVRRRESGNGVAKVFDGGTGFELYRFLDNSGANEVSGCVTFTFISGRWRVTSGEYHLIQTEG